jgi:hypothetical protein
LIHGSLEGIGEEKTCPGQHPAVRIANDGTYVGGEIYTMAPDGTYVGCDDATLTPDDTFIEDDDIDEN